jgi:hypothetical protein
MAKTANIAEIIGAFISAIFGLALTPEVSKYSKTIENDNNSSDLMVLLAPYVPLFWLLGTMGIAGMLMYSYFKN